MSFILSKEWASYIQKDVASGIPVRNNTGGALTAPIVIRVSGDYSTSEIPLVDAISSINDKPIGVMMTTLPTSTTGVAVVKGRYSVSGLDCSGATIGDKVYSTSSGLLTLTPTVLEVGQVINNTNPGVVYFNIGAGTGSSTSSGFTPVSKTSANSPYTTSANELVSYDASGGNSIVNIPTAVGSGGKQIIVVKTDSTGNVVSLVPNGSEKLSGFSSYGLGAEYEWIKIISDDINWIIIG